MRGNGKYGDRLHLAIAALLLVAGLSIFRVWNVLSPVSEGNQSIDNERKWLEVWGVRDISYNNFFLSAAGLRGSNKEYETKRRTKLASSEAESSETLTGLEIEAVQIETKTKVVDRATNLSDLRHKSFPTRIPAQHVPKSGFFDLGGAHCSVGCSRTYIDRAKQLDEAAGSQLTRLLCSPFNYSTSPKPLIIGAGAGTTGTQTVAYAVSLLGLKVIHFREMWNPWGRRNLTFGDKSDADPGIGMQFYRLWGVEEDVNATSCLEKGRRLEFKRFEDVDAVFDSPFPAYTYDLIRAYPNSRIILTVRDPSTWVVKRRTHHPNPDAHYLRSCGAKLANLSESAGAELFRATNDWVQCVSRVDRIVKINVFRPYRDQDLWDKLMHLTGVQNSTLRNSCQFPRKPGALVCGNVTFYTHQGNIESKDNIKG